MGYLDDDFKVTGILDVNRVTRPFWRDLDFSSKIDVAGLAPSKLPLWGSGPVTISDTLADMGPRISGITSLSPRITFDDVAGNLPPLDLGLSSDTSLSSTLLQDSKSILTGLTSSTSVSGNLSINNIIDTKLPGYDLANDVLSLSGSIDSGLGKIKLSPLHDLVGHSGTIDLQSPLINVSDVMGMSFGARVDSSLAVSGLLPSSRKFSLAIDDILESAKAFELEYGGTDVEEDTEDFLDDHAFVAEQIVNSPFLVTLSLKQRKQVARFLGFVAFLVFVSIAVYGYVMGEGLLEILSILGIAVGPWPAGKATYTGSKKIMDKYLAPPEDSE